VNLRGILSIAVLLSAAVPTASRATTRVAGVHLGFPDAAELASAPLADEAAWVGRHGCRLRTPDAAERARLKAAAALASNALDSPGFARRVLAARDWVRRDAGTWVRDAAAGSDALIRLVTSRRRVHLLVLDDGRGHACTALGEVEGVRAYAPHDADIVVFQRTYVRDAPTTRELAATLLHETLHVLGFTHPAGALDHSDPAYQRSVPVRLAGLLLADGLAASGPDEARQHVASSDGGRALEAAAPPDATSPRAAASEVHARGGDISAPHSP
jgi:hypothetical protein